MSEQEAQTRSGEAIGWDDRKALSWIWPDHAQLPAEGLSDGVYAALIAVARFGEERGYADALSDNDLAGDRSWPLPPPPRPACSGWVSRQGRQMR